MFSLDDEDIYELRLQVRSEKRRERCQCDVEFGTCPGPTNCPFSDHNQGEEDE